MDQKKKIENYKNNFNKDTYKNVAIRIRKDEIEVLEMLESVPSKNAYIINLIKEDIENKKIIEKIKNEKN